MPRLMSFSHTIDQIHDRTKTVTRRLGWRTLRPGQRVWAVRKAMGLRLGEKVERLSLLEVVSNRRERLYDITDDDVAREGFPEKNRKEFIAMFRRINRGMPRFAYVSRIEFKYVEEPDHGE